MDTAKTTSTQVFQKCAGTTGDLIGNEIADKLTSVGKVKNKEKKSTRILHTSRTWQQIIDDLKRF